MNQQRTPMVQREFTPTIVEFIEHSEYRRDDTGCQPGRVKTVLLVEVLCHPPIVVPFILASPIRRSRRWLKSLKRLKQPTSISPSFARRRAYRSAVAW